MQPVVEKNGLEGHSGGDEDGDAEPVPGLRFEDPELVPNALRALNTMRKNKQFYDVVLHTGSVEVPAHRAVLAAVSPYLFELFTTDQDRNGATSNGTLPLSYKLNGICEKRALLALVDYAYTGNLYIEAQHVAGVLQCAWQLRMDGVVRRCGDWLVSRLCRETCLDVRALPGLSSGQLKTIDSYIINNFRSLCDNAGLISIRVEVLCEGCVEDAAHAQALDWLRDSCHTSTKQHIDDILHTLSERVHLLYACEGSMRDCIQRPPARGDSQLLQDYRRMHSKDNSAVESVVKKEASGCDGNGRGCVLYTHDIAERFQHEQQWSVIASDKMAEKTYVSLVSVRGRLCTISVQCRGADGGDRSDSGCHTDDGTVTELADMLQPRAAHGVVELNQHILVCGGYDRVECLKSCELYDPERNMWTPFPDMRQARGRFNVAKVGNKIFAVGGSNGHIELDSVEMYQIPLDYDQSSTPSMSASLESDLSVSSTGGDDKTNGQEKKKKAWSKCANLPLARSHASVCSDESEGLIYCIGGWTGQVGVRDCHVYDVNKDEWREMPPLTVGRYQSGCCVWDGSVWALGGCDAWHALTHTERYSHSVWTPGPQLSVARRGCGACTWRDRLWVAGGSDGTSSLTSTEWLSNITRSKTSSHNTWKAGPMLRTARASLALLAVQDKLYAVGGYSGKQFLSTMEYLCDVDGEWTTVYRSQCINVDLTLTQQHRSHDENTTDQGTDSLSIQVL